MALLAIPLTPASANPSDSVVISEIQSRAVNVDSDVANAIELHNLSAGNADISLWQVRFFDASSAVTAVFTVPPQTVISPGGFVIIRDPAYLPILCAVAIEYSYFDSSPDVLPDSGAVVLFDEGGNEIDRVGTVVPLSENGPAPSLSASTDRFGMSVSRDPLVDTDDNSDDFSLQPQTWGCG
jgi:hypothetical protein